MSSEISVRFPQLYWLADKASFPELSEDPDDTDGRRAPRHPDKHCVDWTGVGAVVEDVGDRLVQGRYRVDSDNAEWGEVSVDFGALSDTEVEIVCRWFMHAVGPSGDPDNLENGRHRLWNCWSANQDLMLPVESSLLCATLEPADSAVHEHLPHDALTKLRAVTPAVRKRSPGYVDALTKLSSQYPAGGEESGTAGGVV